MTKADVTTGGWACFPGAVPPREVLEGWRLLALLPRGAQQNLWQLLWLALREPEGEGAQEALQRFAQRFEANPANLLGALRACEFLLRKAAALGLSSEAFRADLERLAADGDDAGVELMMSQFDEAQAFLRDVLLETTLADHGNVLTAFDWRVDRVRLSNHGRVTETDVVFVNFKYRQRGADEQLSLQLTPHAVLALRELFTQLTSGAQAGEPEP